ncbi:hypothetical protein BDW66DRAFT_132272 [Aspergillus desertorum]
MPRRCTYSQRHCYTHLKSPRLLHHQRSSEPDPDRAAKSTRASSQQKQNRSLPSPFHKYHVIARRQTK